MQGSPQPPRTPRENSIGRGRRRVRAPAEAVPAALEASRIEPKTPAKGSSFESAITGRIRDRYIQVRTRFHFPDGDPAFRVHAHKTIVQAENTEVIRDVLEFERARHGDTLRVTGSVSFRREVWTQGVLAGIRVRGYRPSEVERAQVARLIAREREQAQELLAGKLPQGPQEPLPERVAPAQETPKREREGRTEGRVYQGRLIAHGPAPYQHDRQADMSYFVKLETEAGERVLWGLDFARAIKESLSGVKSGDAVSVQQVGERPVTVVARRKDASGNFVRKEEVVAYRNRWLVERQDFIQERESIARVIRDPTIDAPSAVKQHPNLVGTYMELQAAKLAAQNLYPNEEDRQRFISRFRNAVADEIARGERFSVPRLRTPAVREAAREAHRKDPDLTQERVLG